MLLSAANGLFRLDDQPFFPRFGTIPYSQIEPERWPIMLESFKKTGLNGVSAAVPWSWHEVEEHTFDFNGSSHPSRNLIAFIEACRTAGLPLILNPGPFSWAQLFSWGHPLKREQVVRWYENLGAILKQYQSDPVIALQIGDCAAAIPDCHYAVVSTRVSASVSTLNHNHDYNHDHFQNHDHDSAIRFRNFLEHKYGNLEALNNAWGSFWQDWAEIRPLAPPIKHGVLCDWQEFVEQWSYELLDWLADLAKRILLPVPLIMGYDLTTKYSDTPYAADFPFGAALSSDAAAMCLESPSCTAMPLESPPICAARLDCAGLDGHSNITADTAVQAAISAIAHGTRGFSSWIFQIPPSLKTAASGSDPDKNHDENHLGDIKAVTEFIAQYEKDLLSASDVLDDIAILLYEPNQRLFPEDFLFRRYADNPDPSSFIRRTGLYGIYALLTASGFRPRFMSLENADESELQPCRVLFFPNLGYIDRGSYNKLVQYVEAGGILVTLPVQPKYDLSGRSLDTSALYAAPEKDQKSAGRLGLLATWTWHLARRRLFSPKSRSGSQPKVEHGPELSRNDFPTSDVSLKMSVNMRLDMDMRAEMEPVLKTHLPAMPMVDTTGRYIRGDIQHTVFVPREDARVLLLSPSSSEILGYAMPFGKGTSAVLGTVIGGSLMFPHYYRLSEAEIRTLCEFCKDLLAAEWGLEPRTKSELPVEVAYRTTPRHTYVFLINRGHARTGRFELARDLCHGAPEVVFSWGGSEAEPVLLGQIQAKLGEDGIVVLRYRR